MKIKVIGWNINQRSGRGKGIPQFVIEELIAQRADLIVLTELFKSQTLPYFWDEMERAGYCHAITDNNDTNDVGILWRQEKFDLSSVDASAVSTESNNIPNMLSVDLRVKGEREYLITVIGFRIRMVDYPDRAKELGFVLNHANKPNPILMISDCNNLRRGTSETTWNLNIVDSMLSSKGFTRHTPCGQSIYADRANTEDFEFAEDHIITRDLSVDLGDYDRSFVNRDPIAYPWGKSFQADNGKHNTYIEPGFPDHAIVKGYVDFL